MSEEISGISGKGMINRLTAKKQASMEATCGVKEVKPTQEMGKLEKMRMEIDHAFTLMQEIRGRLEEAYNRLNPE